MHSPHPHSTSLCTALDTVKYGDLSPNDFLHAIYSGHDFEQAPLAVRSAPRAVLDAVWANPRGLVTWEGLIPEATGRYITANPFSVKALGKYDEHDLHVGRGLRAEAIGRITTLTCEVDVAADGGLMPMEEQAALYDEIEKESGLRFAAAVLSGDVRPGAAEAAGLTAIERLAKGKSLHMFLALNSQPVCAATLALRQSAIDSLVALIWADHSARDLSRKMRMGGVAARGDGGRVRVQTLLRAECVSFDLADVDARLKALCVARGIDVPVRIEAIQFIARAQTTAKSWGRALVKGDCSIEDATDNAEYLREVALSVRQAGRVTEEHRGVLALVGSPKGKAVVSTPSGITREIVTGHVAGGWDAETTMLTTSTGVGGTAAMLWSTYRKGYRVPDIHCISHADAHASAFLTHGNKGFVVHCPTCGKIPAGRQNPPAKSPSNGLVPRDVVFEAAQLANRRQTDELLELSCSLSSSTVEGKLVDEWALSALAEDAEDAAEDARRQRMSKAYGAKLAAKREAASRLPPDYVAGAKLAAEYASTIHASVVEAWKLKGVLINAHHTCGMVRALHQAENGRFSVTRLPCKALSCPNPICGALRVAQKCGALLHLPLLHHGVLEAPLGNRPLWVYRMKKTEVTRFTNRFTGRESRTCSHRSIKDSIEQVLDSVATIKEEPGGYVVFHGVKSSTVITTSYLPPSRKGQQKCVGQAVRASDSHRLLTGLCMAAHRAGVDPAGTVTITANMSSGQSLCLDPSTITRVAKASSWISVGRVDLSQVLGEIRRRNIGVHIERDELRIVRRVTTDTALEPDVVVDIVLGHRAKSDPTGLGALVVDVCIDDILSEFA